MHQIINENKEWIDLVWEKLKTKLRETSVLSSNKIPYTTIDGVHDDCGGENEHKISWWTNGFWPALMWLMYSDTKEECFKTAAENAEIRLDEVLCDFDALDHDVGFMWHISSGANYKLTGNEKSKNRALLAASHLAARFNTAGDFLRSWNWSDAGDVIIDCMMNIPLLYWASDVTKDERFRKIAIHHADKTMNNHIRGDGSVYHVIRYDTNNGDVIGYPITQGYDAENSSWSRGQSWALYGFVLSYIHTGDKKYLDTAKKVAHYFIAAICNDGYVPVCDFRSPDEPVYYDTTAGACAACGLIEIANAVPEFEKKMYLNAAINILKALEKKHCDWTLKQQAVLLNGSERYGRGVNMPIIYGDYFFAEAIYKLKGNKLIFW